jgi:NAD(P)-dependent dehydrogenase (short-subunit alcohol dehydrogenase family)
MKTFLGIGSGPGIGLATAKQFAREGFRIVLGARNTAKTQILAERLTAQGYEAHIRTVDAGDPSSVASMVHDVERSFDGIDVMHYNAASMRKAGITNQPGDTFNQDLAVNIGGALAASQAVIPNMRERRAGSILLTGGGYALKPSPDYLTLSIGKAGIRAFALAVFESLARDGIHVATVTIGETVLPDSREAETVAQHFWTLHNQPKGSWTPEIQYTW